MKKLLLGLALLTSISSSADVGNCKIHAISDSSTQDNTPHRVFNVSKENVSLTDCFQEFASNIYYLKSCGVIVGGKIHYIELRFTISGRTVSTVESLNVTCN